MKHWAVFFVYLFLIGVSYGQTPEANNTLPNSDRLNLVSSNSGRINAKTGHMVFYRPVYEHKGNTLSADSGYIYEDEIKRQFFEAFGNVVITQPSGTVIYSDKLHYDAAAQHAQLTGNVKMVDANSVLTTSYLTYNMRSKTGTYQNGGRIVSKGDTITSQRAHYFENTSDAYFRHKVVVRTPNVKVYTDSMRYNSLTKETYFFGPTNIKGNKNENLYTERGNYNTGTGIARFNKNNLYTEGSKFLKGDSLYYHRDMGIGEAYRNVVFVDTLDKFYGYGGKGLYRQSDESILLTEKPLIITVVKNDSTSKETKIDSTQIDETKKSKKELRREKKEAEKRAEIDQAEKELEKPVLADSLAKSSTDSLTTAKVDSVYLTADTLFSRVIFVKDYHALQLNLNRDGGQLLDTEEPNYGDDENEQDSTSLSMDSTHVSLDSLQPIEGGLPDKNVADSVIRDAIDEVSPDSTSSKSTKPRPIFQLEHGQDTAKTLPVAPLPVKPGKPTPQKRAAPDEGIERSLKADSTLRQKAVIPTGNEADDKINEALRVAQSPDTTISTISALPLDSTTNVSDTARTRIVKAHYNVRLFKSDLQAVADSTYYGMVDSMFRFMGRPMIWAQGSQISADTIYMQLVNQQLDNALLQNNAFMVNAVLDSTKFNQLKGRKITAFFANNDIERLFVDGNAENISFAVDEKTKIITEMLHDRGARIKVKMENKEIIDYITIRKVDQKVYPFKMVNQENEILKGFIWRPQDRPTSKEDLLNRKRELPRDTSSRATDTLNSTMSIRDTVPPAQLQDKTVENQDNIIHGTQDIDSTDPIQDSTSLIQTDSTRSHILQNSTITTPQDSITTSSKGSSTSVKAIPKEQEDLPNKEKAILNNNTPPETKKREAKGTSFKKRKEN